MSIVLENLTKRFGAHLVVNKVSLEIADGELFVLLGASGSGKSTILRMIAGLTPCDAGRVLIRGRDVTQLAPQSRGTGFVFQNYSIFRHMTLQENIEFGLKIRKVPKADRVRRCEELLDLVGLAGLGDRYASQISGGQQQRVALARALAYEPTVLLLDEPLGALDVKIRVQLRRSLKEIQRRLRVTTVLVTHDQEEAYELADRIAVLERGVLLEVGWPEQLYAQPKSLSVASFLGGGTVLAGRVVNCQASFGPVSLALPPGSGHEEGASVELLFRPEQVLLSADEPKGLSAVLGKGSVVEQTFVGATRRLRVRLPRLPGTRQIVPAASFGEEGLLVDAIVSAELVLPAQELWVALRGWTILGKSRPRLLALDTGSGPTLSLQLARLVAERMQASVTVLGVGDGHETDELRRQLKHRSQEVGLKEAETHASSGELVQQVAAHCAGALFEMLVVPRNLDGKDDDLDREILSLLQYTDVPALVAGTETRAAVSQMLICTRAGEPGKADIRFGGRLARYLGARVTLLHVTREAGGASQWAQLHLRRASSTLSALEVPNEILIRPYPDAAEAILKEAASQDLVIIGGHGPQFRSIFGKDDVTNEVVRRAHCPVLVVPSTER